MSNSLGVAKATTLTAAFHSAVGGLVGFAAYRYGYANPLQAAGIYTGFAGMIAAAIVEQGHDATFDHGDGIDGLFFGSGAAIVGGTVLALAA